MPYDELSNLPDSLEGSLLEHIQKIYWAAYNSAWDEYKDAAERRDDASREEVSHRVAWTAVGHPYEKDNQGKWQPKK